MKSLASKAFKNCVTSVCKEYFPLCQASSVAKITCDTCAYRWNWKTCAVALLALHALNSFLLQWCFSLDPVDVPKVVCCDSERACIEGKTDRCQISTCVIKLCFPGNIMAFTPWLLFFFPPLAKCNWTVLRGSETLVPRRKEKRLCLWSLSDHTGQIYQHVCSFRWA